MLLFYFNSTILMVNKLSKLNFSNGIKECAAQKSNSETPRKGIDFKILLIHQSGVKKQLSGML